jgi:hypothetical protein
MTLSFASSRVLYRRSRPEPRRRKFFAAVAVTGLGLEKQVDAPRARREAEFEAVLTPAQKKRLAEHEQQKKAESAARKAAATKAPEEAGR